MLTQQGAIVGTAAYMAPEQGRGQSVDGRADLFSLGVVLYRASTGQQPFHGSDTVSRLLAVATHQPTSPHRLDPTVPKDLSNLVMKLLEKDPARRPASAGEVVQLLQALETARVPLVAASVARPVAVPVATTATNRPVAVPVAANGSGTDATSVLPRVPVAVPVTSATVQPFSPARR